MSKFIVSEVRGMPREWESQNGPMLTYTLVGILDGSPAQVQIHTTKAKPRTPVVGEEIDCEVVKDHPTYGKTIKRLARVAQGGGSGKGASESPERQASIERQNSLSNAIAYCKAKADLLLAAKRPEEALQALTGTHVLQVALYFQHYNSGKLTLRMGPEEIARLFGYEPPRQEERDPFEDAAEYLE
ncbi:MAG TPA: hypothetical protein VFB38_21355 [Chthonomonadaceae bacterium]|nr:hypothetical protein [Chthonomonadaceae bacterium]HZT40957.1 hypothetical protein [Chthonomonadaceae bacterium]